MDQSLDQSQSATQQSVPSQPFPPQQQASSPVPNGNAPSKKSFLKIILMIFLALIVLTSTTTVMFAYGVIPIGSEELRDKVADVIMKIPFMPKTPRYVLRTAVEAHQKITRMSIDASLASTSGVGGMFGLGSLDAQVKGSFDYTDFDNLKATFNAKITKDFDVDVLAVDQKAYFKINSYPSFVGIMFSSMGIPEDILKEISNKWFYYDLSSLNTEARRNLQDQQQKFDLNQSNQKLLEILNNKDIAKSISMINDQIDSIATHHIVFKPTDEALDTLWKTYNETDNTVTPNRSLSQDNISKTVKNFTFDAWIDKSHYLVRKMTVGVVFKSPKSSYSIPSINSLGLPLSEQEIPVSFVAKFTDFNQQVLVTPPQNPIKFEDFLKTIMTRTATQSGSLFLKQ